MKNMGKLNRFIRIGIAGLLLYLCFTKEIVGTLAIAGLIVSGLMLLTSFINFCPLYTAFGWNTKAKKD